uniref:Uncharacterized protein n=1 Tax=Solanum tuberosum TaxID=4113 RepID=M1D8U8_SOLTU
MLPTIVDSNCRYLSITEGRGGKSVEINQGVEGDSKLKALVSQLNDLATKIKEMVNQCKRQGKHPLPHQQKSSRSDEKKRIDNTLLIILQKLHEQDRMLEALKESMEVLNLMIGSH